eukprot:5926765-Pleurochrysis_carterae.AAC.3
MQVRTKILQPLVAGFDQIVDAELLWLGEEGQAEEYAMLPLQPARAGQQMERCWHLSKPLLMCMATAEETYKSGMCQRFEPSNRMAAAIGLEA